MMADHREAAMAMAAAEFDERLQRAVRRRPNPFQRSPGVGDSVFYWRHHGTTNMAGHAKRAGRWRGPALVAAVELGIDVLPHSEWCARTTVLLCGALEHLRPDYDTPYDDEGLSAFDDVGRHLKMLCRGAKSA